jgi:hypothetical protein
MVGLVPSSTRESLVRVPNRALRQRYRARVLALCEPVDSAAEATVAERELPLAVHRLVTNPVREFPPLLALPRRCPP